MDNKTGRGFLLPPDLCWPPNPRSQDQGGAFWVPAQPCMGRTLAHLCEAVELEEAKARGIAWHHRGTPCKCCCPASPSADH